MTVTTVLTPSGFAQVGGYPGYPGYRRLEDAVTEEVGEGSQGVTAAAVPAAAEAEAEAEVEAASAGEPIV